MKRWFLTTGDPRGSNHYLLAKAWQKIPKRYRSRLIICSDEKSLKNAFKHFGVSYPVDQVLDVPYVTTKMTELEASRISAYALEEAVSFAKSGKIEAMITMPVSKERLSIIYSNFTGQTEWLANKLGGNPTMMFCPAKWRKGDIPIVFLATTHSSIKNLPINLTKEKIINTAINANNYFIKIGVKKPRIAVLALNPHAGENGKIGREEIDLIIPCIKFLKKKKINVEGPYSSDSFFIKQYEEFDGVIAMYHDQGLIIAKHAWGFGAVNVTLGLPIIRTSPGHGIAENVAPERLDTKGLISSIEVAGELSEAKS